MKILIVGLGSIGRYHARILREIRPDCRIFALRSGMGWGPEAGVTDVHDLTELPEKVELAIISSPTYLHPLHMQKVLSLKSFLFLEKPLALTVEEGELMVEAIESTGIGSYVGCHLRFHPELQNMRHELQKNHRSITSAHAVCHSWLPDWQPGRDYHKSFRADPAQSGGVHLELIHEIDYVTWILGPPLKRTVTLHDSPEEFRFFAPSEAHYELMYPDFAATIDLSYFSQRQERKFEIQFSDGTARTVDFLAPKTNLHKIYISQMNHVLSCVAGSEVSLHSAREALQTLALALP